MNALLVISALVCLLALVMAEHGLYRLTREVRGQDGHRLTRIAMWMGAILVLTQVGAIINFIMLAADPMGTVDARIVIFTLLQIVTVTGVIVALGAISRIRS